MEKITDRTRYEKIAEVIPEYAEWAKKKIAQMDKKNEARKNGEKKPTKAQLESQALEAPILDFLTTEGVQVKVIAEAFNVATQKVTPILKRLVEAGTVVKTEGKKGVSLYAKVEAPTEE